MSKHILGIDIRARSISAVLVKSASKTNRIEALAHTAISGFQDVEKGLAACLEKISQTAEMSGVVCMASLPADQFFFRNLKVPFREKKKIRQILPYELEAILPFPVEELVIDFYEPQSDRQADLVSAAIEKSKMEFYLAALSALNIDPKIVTVGGYVTACCLAKFGDIPDNCLFVDVGQTRFMLCLIVSGEVHFIRSFPRPPDLSAADGLLAAEIQRTRHAFSENVSHKFDPTLIFLSGNGLSANTFKEGMLKQLGISIETPNLLLTAGLSTENATHMQWDSAQMDHAFALTLIEKEDLSVLNFRQGPFAFKKHWAKYKNQLIKTGILAGLILALIFTGIIVNSFTLKKKIDRLDARIVSTFKAAFPKVEKIVDPLQQMQTKLKSARLQFAYPEEAESRIRHIDILNDISKLVPVNTDVELTRLVTGPEVVLISGQTDTFNSVNIVKNSLEKGHLFEKITISSANIDKTENRVRFNLKIQLHSTVDIARPVKTGTDGRKRSNSNPKALRNGKKTE